MNHLEGLIQNKSWHLFIVTSLYTIKESLDLMPACVTERVITSLWATITSTVTENFPVKSVFLVGSCGESRGAILNSGISTVWLLAFSSIYIYIRTFYFFSFQEETHSYLSTSELEDKVDALTEELLCIIEDEHHFLNSKGNEDLLLYYLEITGLEKDCLVKQINALEEKIDLGRKL